MELAAFLLFFSFGWRMSHFSQRLVTLSIYRHKNILMRDSKKEKKKKVVHFY